VDQQITLLGGWSKFENLVKGKNVALKVCVHNPSVLEDPMGKIPYPVDDINAWKPPWPTKGAAHSSPHPLLAKAVAKAIYKAGATEVNLTEGCDAGGSMQLDTACSGYDYHLANLSWLKMVELDMEKVHMVPVPNPLCMKEFGMPDVLDGHVVINVARISSHGARFTGALKSWIGIQPAGWCGGSRGNPIMTKATRAAYETLTLPQKLNCMNPVSTPLGNIHAGIFQKGRAHSATNNAWNTMQKESPDRGGVNGGNSASGVYGPQIADLVSVVPQPFSIIDCCGGTELGQRITWPTGYSLDAFLAGNYGSAGFRVDMKKRVGHYGLIGSYDSVAADATLAQVMGWEPMTQIVYSTVAGIGGDLMQLWYARQKGLGENDPRCIDIKGVDAIPWAGFAARGLTPARPFPIPVSAQAIEEPLRIHPDFQK
jgi:hypothetical protein